MVIKAETLVRGGATDSGIAELVEIVSEKKLFGTAGYDGGVKRCFYVNSTTARV